MTCCCALAIAFALERSASGRRAAAPELAPAATRGTPDGDPAEETGAPTPAPFGGGEDGLVRVIVRSADDEAPLEGVRVDAVPLSDASCGRRPIGGATDVRGEVAFRAPSGPLEVFAGDATAFTAVEPGRATVVEVAWRRGADVRGSVADASGAAVPGALVWVSGPAGPAGSIAGMTERGGRFRIPDPGRNRRLAARAPGLAWTACQDVPAERRGRRPELLFVLAGLSRSIRGAVVDESGAPARGARVAARHAPGAAPPILAAAEESGAFEIAGAPAGAWTLEAWAPGHAPAAARVEVADGDRDGVVLRLERDVVVTGTARDPAGRPLPRLRIRALASGLHAPAASAISGADGSFRMDHVPAAPVVAKAGCLSGPDVTASLDLSGLSGFTWDPVIDCGRVLAGVVRDDRGSARAYARIRSVARREPGAVWVAETVSDRAGAFEIADCPAEPLTVRCDVAGWGEGGTWTLPDVVAGGPRLEIVVPESARPSSFVSGTIAGPGGAPALGVEVRATRLPATDPAAATVARAPDGRFRIGPVPPGTYAIEAASASGSLAALAECTLSAGAAADLGALSLDREGFLRVRLRRAPGAPASQRLTVLDGRARRVAGLRPVAGFAVSEPMAPGAYVLRVEGDGVARAEMPFVIEPGETTAIDVPIEASR